jgi:hypothetical protein
MCNVCCKTTKVYETTTYTVAFETSIVFNKKINAKYIPFPNDNNSMAYMYYKNIINI